MAKEFSNLIKHINLHIHEAQWISNRTNTKMSTSRHLRTKLFKENLESRKRKWLITHRGITAQLRDNFTSETIEPEYNGWHNQSDKGGGWGVGVGKPTKNLYPETIFQPWRWNKDRLRKT